MRFRRGDANGDGAVNVADATAIIDLLFDGEASPGCMDAADANGDARLDLSDAMLLLLHLFPAGEAPAAPGASKCGRDPAAGLGCARYDACRP